MIHQVKDSANNVSFTNYIRGSANGYFRNIVNNYDKTGIYGYTSSDLMGLSVVNNILGDKNDYTANGDNRDSIINGNFSVQGYSYNDGNNTGDFSSVAWYWTVIANKVLTTDQINQVIAYFNLDRCVEPTVWYDVQKQGLTNETPDSDWYLKDFSKNGFDMSLFNFAKDGNSGIGQYNYPNWKVTATTANTYHNIAHYTTINGIYSINVSGVSEMMQSIGMNLEVRYTTPNGWIYNDIYEDGVYSYTPPDGTTELTLRFGGIPGIVNEPCNITITQIPSHAGALCLDGINDFGQFVGDLGLKDYTFIADRAYDRIVLEQAPFIASKSTNGQAPFLMEYLRSDNYVYPHSFGATTKTTNLNIQRQISYQSTYVYNGNSISKGTSVDTGDGLTIGNSGSTGEQYSPLCLWSLMLFPYSMSEFLIERQLKKHKLGTLYPDMVEWRPIIKSNVEYASISYLLRIPGQGTVTPVIGQYYPILSTDTSLVVYVATNGVDEVANLTINGQEPTSSSIHVDGRFKFEFPFNNSPQKINITIDEYIRFEDIVQPYPSLFTLIDYDTEEVYSWGSKLKVGARFKGNVVNLLPNIYEWQGDVLYNGEVLNWGIKPGVVAKEMVFSWNMPFKYLIDNNEPKCILSPRLLRIPNSSYKILGYIPDISGHGNNGVIHNSAYAEGSGVNEDGSYQLDGVDDFVTIPTLFSGGKQVLMKVNWDKTIADAILYDQRGYPNEFAIYNADVDNNNNPVFAYQARNNGQTYIDGILNKNIKASELRAITHNITITNELSTGTNTSSPVIGSNRVHDAYFTNMALYDFMLFDSISTDDKIKQLNEYVGIEGNTDDLFNETN